MKRSSRWVVWPATVGLFCALLAAGAPTASGAAATLKVQVGAPLFALPQANHAPADGDRFYAPAMSVHRGDTVTFDFQGFHTATLLPANTDADTWVDANASGLGKPYSFIVPDPDEGATGVKINNAGVIPSALDCGSSTDPCPYDGSKVVNSGIFDPSNIQAQSFSFSTRIDANPGATFTFLCLIHLGMRQTVSVVADTETTTTQPTSTVIATRRPRATLGSPASWMRRSAKRSRRRPARSMRTPATTDRISRCSPSTPRSSS